MHHHKPGHNLFWPEGKEGYWGPFIHVLALILVPATLGTEQQYKVDEVKEKKSRNVLTTFDQKGPSWHHRYESLHSFLIKFLFGMRILFGHGTNNHMEL